jgi:hypothetical protein
VLKGSTERVVQTFVPIVLMMNAIQTLAGAKLDVKMAGKGTCVRQVGNMMI